MTENKLLRMDNVGIVVESLDDAISFFSEIGLKLEGRGTIEGEWAGRVTGLGSQCVEIARYSIWQHLHYNSSLPVPSSASVVWMSPSAKT